MQPQEMHVKKLTLPQGKSRSDGHHAEVLASAAAEPASETSTAVAMDLPGPAAAPDSPQLAAESAGQSAQHQGSLPHQATADAVVGKLMQEAAAEEHAIMPSAAAAAVKLTGPGIASPSQRPAAEFASEAAARHSSLQLTAESAPKAAESADRAPAQLHGLLPHQAAADTLVNGLGQDAAGAEQEADDALEGLQGRGHSQPSRVQTLEVPEAAPVLAAPLPRTGSAAEQVSPLQHAAEGGEVQSSPAGQPAGSPGVAASVAAAPAATLGTGRPYRVTGTVEAALEGLVTEVGGLMQFTEASAGLPSCNQQTGQPQSLL